MLMRRLSEFAVCVAIVGLSFIAGADDKETAPNTVAPTEEKVFRDVESAEKYFSKRELHQSLHLVTVTMKDGKEVASKKEVKPDELAALRLYIRFEPRRSRKNKETGVMEFVGRWGLDLTNESKKFAGEPRVLMEPGSVIPGNWVGDLPEHHYVILDKAGPLAERLQLTKLPVRIVWEEFYEDGSFDRKISFGGLW